MYRSEGQGWHVSADTHGQMLLALYVRDLAGLQAAGAPSLSRVAPAVRPVAAAELSAHETAELRQEWQQWWHRLLRGSGGLEESLEPPGFPAFGDSPTLQRLLRAHYGSAFAWTNNRLGEYRDLSQDSSVAGQHGILERMILERELVLDRPPKPFDLRLVELPLAEPRAWFVEPGTVILSQDLLRHEDLFRSYLEPVVQLLV